MSRWCSTWLLAACSLLAHGCDDTSCTLVACSHQAQVTYPTGLVSAAYDLTLTFPDANTLSARCSDPGAPELADNAIEVSCTGTGFEIEGDAAAARTVRVTIIDTESGSTLVDNIEVRLDAIDELQPNGPDCEPTCIIRNGQLTAP